MQNGRPESVHANARNDKFSQYPVRMAVADAHIPWAMPPGSWYQLSAVPVCTVKAVLDAPYADRQEQCTPACDLCGGCRAARRARATCLGPVGDVSLA